MTPNTSMSEDELDEILSPQIMNNDVCFECGIDFPEAKQAIRQYVTKKQIEDWTNYWKFWIDPLNDDVECEEYYIKARLAVLNKQLEGGE